MTLKQDRLMEALLSSKTMKEASIKAGYSYNSGSRQMYRKSTKQHIAKILADAGITKESLTNAYQSLLTLCQTKEDYSTAKATIDSLAKLHNFLKDSQSTQVFVFNEDITKDLPPIIITPIDVST